MEPPAEPDGRRPRLRPHGPFRVPVVTDRSLRGAVAGAGLAAAIVGLLGVDAGLLWVVIGVWTARAAVGARLGVAWGVACVAAGLRWGTLGLADLSAATRAVGAPTIAVGPLVAAAGAVAVFLAALADEASVDGLMSDQLVARGASGAALICLVPAFLVPGAGEPNIPVSMLVWVGAAGVLAAAAGASSSIARRVPGPVLLAVACLGTLMIGAGRGPG